MAQYVFYSDGGHGWLRVPLQELVLLGIEDRITHYSRMRGRWAYLEEDDDADAFIRAKQAADPGWDRHADTSEQICDGPSPIRDFPQYAPSAAHAAHGIPKLDETDGIQFDRKIIHQRWFEPESGFYWLIAEYDGRDTMFGYANLACDIDAEWGYISVSEIRSIGARTDDAWKPVPFGKIPEDGILASVEDPAEAAS